MAVGNDDAITVNVLLLPSQMFLKNEASISMSIECVGISSR